MKWEVITYDIWHDGDMPYVNQAYRSGVCAMPENPSDLDVVRAINRFFGSRFQVRHFGFDGDDKHILVDNRRGPFCEFRMVEG